MVPRPKHLPVEIFMPIASGRTIDMIAQYGLKAMVTLNGEKILDDVVRAFHDACHRHNRPVQLGPGHGAGAPASISPTARKRRSAGCEPAHDERYKWFAPFGFVRYADEQGRTWGTPGAPATIPTLARGRQAEGVVLRHAGARSSTASSRSRRNIPGLEDFMIHWAEGLPPDEFIEQLRWFAREVMPAFNRS